MKRIYLDTNYRRIAIDFPYSPGMVKRMRDVPDCSFEPNTKLWHVPATKFHATFIKKWGIQYGFQVDYTITKLTKQTKQPLLSTADVDERLYAYQKEDVTFMQRAEGRVLNALAPGLGKTIETLAYLNTVAEDAERVLIVAPASVIYNWQDEINKWIDWDSQVVLTSKTVLDKRAPIWIMSYAIATRRKDLLNYHFDVLILDECHKISNSKTLRSKSIAALSYDRILALSGTPFMNRPIEMYNVLKMIDPVSWSNWFNYAKRYCNGYQETIHLPGGKKRRIWNVKGSSHIKELKDRLASAFFRRTKDEIADQLPPITRSIISVKVHATKYRNALAEAKRETAIVGMGILRKSLGMLKVEHTIDLAKNILDQDEKIVIFAYHLDVVHELNIALEEYGVVSITGKDRPQVRALNMKDFQTKPRPMVMIITTAGGEGINLFAASHIIFAERAWNPQTEEQVEGRLHRIGQHSPVNAYYLVAQSTLDQDIHHLIEGKREVFDDIIGNAKVETSIKGDIMELLKGE